MRLRWICNVALVWGILSAWNFSAHAEPVSPSDQCRFLAITNFENFTVASAENGEKVLQSPVIKSPIQWDQLVVSWNATVATDAWFQIEARGDYADHRTKFYNLAVWSLDSKTHPRHSFPNQKDADGRVSTDTLILAHPGADVEVRITCSGSEAARALRFLGLSFLDSHAEAQAIPERREVWGKEIATPERSQHSYPQQQGWCSPTSLSMVLARWSGVLNRPEMTLDVPEVANDVLDSEFGTGNWPFNTAFAGTFPGMRAYVARFSDLAEVEDWIAAGIPVIMSAPWHLLSPGREATGAGHLVVCIGFTETGDVVINDPATNLQKGQKVRHIYTRANVINAWRQSHNTVYLIYPESAQIPPDRFGHWEQRK
jgi:hypothetical protein